jgi:ABC-type transporter lipoprotein component MlaA
MKDGFTIKDVSNNQLQNTLKKLKVHIMKFYINSVVDYKNLLDQAKKVGSVNVNKNNL